MGDDATGKAVARRQVATARVRDVSRLERLTGQASRVGTGPVESLLLTLDGSGSMGGQAWRGLRKAVGELVSVSDGGSCRLALAIYSNDADLYRTFTDDLPSVLTALPSRCPGGMTDMKGGLSLAQGIDWPTSRRRVILLSDGMPTTGSPLPVALALGRSGVVIDTVACGEDADENTLRKIAAAGNGTFVRCENVTQLRKAFRALESRTRALLGPKT